MIPKQLFFIWFGENKPEYVDFSINAFKEINPNFNVELIWEKDPFKSNNNDIKDVLELIHDKNTSYYEIANRSYAKQYYFNYIGELTKLSDCFRFYLINKYGGIYLDCDTFPVKPFDNELLNYSLIITKNYTNKNNYNWFDMYFIGSEINTSNLLYRLIIPEKYHNNTSIYKNLYVYKSISKYLYNKNHIECKKFYNCIDPDISNNDSDEYFYHFNTFSYTKK